MPETTEMVLQAKRPALLTLKEVCKELRITESTAYYWRQIGKGPRAARIGKNLVYRATEVQAFIEEQFDKRQLTS